MKVSVLLPYWNPHLVPIFSELEKQKRFHIAYGISSEMSKFRKKYRFADPIDKPNCYRLYIKTEKIAFGKLFQDCDVCVSHGVFYKSILPYAFLAKKQMKPFLIMSESDHIIRSNSFKRLVKKVIISFLNSTNFSLLTLGGKQSYLDYLKWGATKWNAFRFGFAPYPLSDSNNCIKKQKSFRILYVGQLIPRKNLEVLVNAMPEIIKDYPETVLQIVGDGTSKESLKVLVNNLEIKRHIEFSGHLNKEEHLKKAYNNADLFVLPSKFEGWGAVINEAMYYGLPIVLSSGVMCKEELLVPGKNGFIFENGRQLVDNIKHMFSLSDMEYSAFRYESKKIIKDWKPDMMAVKLAAIIDNICVNKSVHTEKKDLLDVFQRNSNN